MKQGGHEADLTIPGSTAPTAPVSTAPASTSPGDPPPAHLVARMRTKLRRLYGDDAASLERSLLDRIARFRQAHPQRVETQAQRKRVSERDCLLIAYGDHFRPMQPGSAPLRALHSFWRAHLDGLFSGLHLLPHFPYSSDDGFSVIDFRAVDPALGSWDDVDALAENMDVMFDAVVNHVSAQSRWFQDYLAGKEEVLGDFLEVSPEEDVRSVYRPRALPLLTPFETSRGTRHVWTTFSADQIDLNYASPRVLLEIVDILLIYASHGATLLRLDAVGFLWKRLGTRSFHLEETHLLVQLLRDVFDMSCPAMQLVPEINGPIEENLPYFGNGADEAQMVYNFALPPLVLEAFYEGRATHLRAFWEKLMDTLRASRSEAPALPDTDPPVLFNFLACHDGLGVRAAASVLPEEDFARMVARAQTHGAVVANRTAEDGSLTPYELNGTFWTLLNGDVDGDGDDADDNEDVGHVAAGSDAHAPGSVTERTVTEREDRGSDLASDHGRTQAQVVAVQRFLCAHALLLSLPGVPGLYVHSLFGTPSWTEGYAATKIPRTLNRRKFVWEAVEAALADEDEDALASLDIPYGARILQGLHRLLSTRKELAPLSPHASASFPDLAPDVFAVERRVAVAATSSGSRGTESGAAGDEEILLCVHNLSDREASLRLPEAFTRASQGAGQATTQGAGVKEAKANEEPHAGELAGKVSPHLTLVAGATLRWEGTLLVLPPAGYAWLRVIRRELRPS